MPQQANTCITGGVWVQLHAADTNKLCRTAGPLCNFLRLKDGLSAVPLKGLTIAASKVKQNEHGPLNRAPARRDCTCKQ